jgi:hypothetical protein
MPLERTAARIRSLAAAHWRWSWATGDGSEFPNVGTTAREVTVRERRAGPVPPAS